ncbi:MAG: hypothetical protein IKP72_00130 [Clostridia bacterium]|nr:hypothetical protein [Clostridia bacterium]
MKRTMLCLMAAVVLLAGLIFPAGAESVLDTYAKGRFRSVYDVYSGPGKEYVRANSGKAAYGGGECRIYGVTDNGWVMIGYGLSSGGYRIGYISGEALGEIYNVTGYINYSLTFQPYIACADDYCRVTDDPVIHNKMIYTVPEGSAVTVLSTMGTDWTYVEVQTPNGPMRGFVWSKHLVGGDMPAPTYYVITPRPTARPTPAPTYYYPIYPTYPTAAPTSGAANTYYHQTNRGVWLPTPQTVWMQGSWPVYSGPGTYYYRANNNKATMGGGSCRVYGVEGNWVLIGYGLSNGNYRIGYVSLEALPRMGLSIPYLDFQAATRRLLYAADLIDDPVRTLAPVASLSRGTYVLFLGYTQENGETWAYVEVLAGSSIMRGFVPSWCLQ